MMMLPPTIGILLTVLFGATAIGYLVRVAVGKGVIGRISDILHVLMSFAMLAMPWPWGMTPASRETQIIVFGLATVFYLVLFILRPAAASATDHHGGATSLLFHAVMMASMVIMALAWAGNVGIAFAIFFATAALWYLFRTLRPKSPKLPDRGNSTLLLLMSAGMAVAFYPF